MQLTGTYSVHTTFEYNNVYFVLNWFYLLVGDIFWFRKNDRKKKEENALNQKIE